jgi:hypothetical protein
MIEVQQILHREEGEARKGECEFTVRTHYAGRSPDAPPHLEPLPSMAGDFERYGFTY